LKNTKIEEENRKFAQKYKLILLLKKEASFVHVRTKDNKKHTGDIIIIDAV
jgi:Xaa-Pro aminopeptidase